MFHLCRSLLNSVRLRHINWQNQRFAPEFFHIPSRTVKPLATARDQSNACSFAGKSSRGRPPDAGRCASNDNDAVVRSH